MVKKLSAKQLIISSNLTVFFPSGMAGQVALSYHHSRAWGGRVINSPNFFFFTILYKDRIMMTVNWTKVFGTKVGKNAALKFAQNELSGETLQAVFRAGTDRELSGQIRKLVRERGVALARRITKKAAKRRNMI